MVTIGTDIIEVERIKKAIEQTKGFKKKVFTSKEITYCSKKANADQHFAGRFAAKEALKKAIMSMIPEIETLPFAAFEITNTEEGKPVLKIINKKYSYLQEKYNIEVSISHLSSMATATAIMEKL